MQTRSCYAWLDSSCDCYLIYNPEKGNVFEAPDDIQLKKARTKTNLVIQFEVFWICFPNRNIFGCKKNPAVKTCNKKEANRILENTKVSAVH